MSSSTSSSARKKSPKKSAPRVDWSQICAEAARFGVKRFRPGQQEIIEAVLSGRDVLGIMPTGAGKSLTYQLPALFFPAAAVVVSPLISLMKDQQEKAEQADISAAKLDSTLTRIEEREAVENIEKGGHRLIYVTPERLENAGYLEVLKSGGVSLLVVDEAHCVSQWGHDFRPAYLGLRNAAQALGRPPILAVTATATPEVSAEIVKQLGLARPVIVNTGIDRDNLVLQVFRTVNGGAKRERLRDIVMQADGVGIIYTATVRAANELHKWLRDEGLNAGLYHARLSKKVRERAQEQFMNNECQVMVATKAFGLGIDKPDIRFIVHYNFPDSLESYYQEAGRAGRDGKPANCALLYRLEDRRIQGYFLGGKYPRREHSRKIYEAVAEFSRQPDRPATKISDLVTATGLPARRVKVVVAQLESAGIVERGRATLRRLRDFADQQELGSFLSEYERRHTSDRERLDAIMRYAETTGCRVVFLRTYFGEEPGHDCGHCDNCRARQEGRGPDVPAHPHSTGTAPQESEPEALPDFLRNNGPGVLFSIGDRVRHKRFGTGAVVEISGRNVTVDFGSAGTKRVRGDFVRKAS